MLRFKLGKLAIRVDFLFVALVTLFLLTDKTGISVIALLACGIHELGHMLMFLAVGYLPHELAFELTGIRLTKPKQALSVGKELLVQLAGSGLNLIIFLLLVSTTKQVSFLGIFAVTHLLLGAFNLLPIKSFDGGKVLELILSLFLSDRATHRICSIVDLLCILLLLLVCIFLIITTKNSFTLLVLTVYLLISSLVKILR